MPYGLNESTGYIDYDQMEKSAMLFRPKLIVAGASAYARLYNYARIRQVYDKKKAIVLTDMAHISGSVAVGNDSRVQSISRASPCNCSKFARALAEKGYVLVSGGTDNHLVLVNLKNKGTDGFRVEKVLEAVGEYLMFL